MLFSPAVDTEVVTVGLGMTAGPRGSNKIYKECIFTYGKIIGSGIMSRMLLKLSLWLYYI